MNEKSIRLTSSEIASLWTTYMNDSMSKCILRFMLKHIQDANIKSVVESAYNISTVQMETMVSIFEAENFSMPIGFTEQDVNMEAPWLFTDIFCLTYVNHMSKVGMLAHGGAVSMSFRQDICDFFSNCLQQVNGLYKQSLAVSLNKGINARAPYMEVPRETDFVDSKRYMTNLNPFADKRPLNAIEISYLYMNLVANVIGSKICLAFAQTSQSREIQDFMLRGKEISQKHVTIFTDTLMENDLEAPNGPDTAVSNSTEKTFSDKLMMFHMSLLSASGLGNYATAAAASQRTDLALNYERLSLEITRFAKSGADIMIKHNWLEQPPGVKDRTKLAREKDV